MIITLISSYDIQISSQFPIGYDNRRFISQIQFRPLFMSLSQKSIAKDVENNGTWLGIFRKMPLIGCS